MAPEADEQDVSAYYARLVYDICSEIGITATIEQRTRYKRDALLHKCRYTG